jgi:hypothetical protein
LGLPFAVSIRLIAGALLALVAAGCERKTESADDDTPPAVVNGVATPATTPTRERKPGAQTAAPRSNQPPPAEIWKEFSGDNAFAERFRPSFRRGIAHAAATDKRLRHSG